MEVQAQCYPEHFEMNLDTSDRIAGLALLLAFVSLGFNVWQHYQVSSISAVSLELEQEVRDLEEESLSIDKLGLDPSLSFNFVDHNDDAFFGIELENGGFGPARIKDLFLFISDDSTNDAAETGWKGTSATNEGWRAVLRDLGAPNDPRIRVTQVQGDALVAPGNSVRLVGAPKPVLDRELRSTIDMIGNDLKLAVCYCASYGRCFSEASPEFEFDACSVSSEQ